MGLLLLFSIAFWFLLHVVLPAASFATAYGVGKLLVLITCFLRHQNCISFVRIDQLIRFLILVLTSLVIVLFKIAQVTILRFIFVFLPVSLLELFTSKSWKTLILHPICKLSNNIAASFPTHSSTYLTIPKLLSMQIKI